MNPFLGVWSSFYVITASSAAALTGLMFVVITLVAGLERLRKTRDGVETFSSPTVVHFCAALLVSAILAAPWPALVQPGVTLALAGCGGVAYASRVILRMFRMGEAYLADADDWFWYAIMPLVAYVAITVGAIVLPIIPAKALFVLGGATTLLIFIGIRNAWDTVTYIAVEKSAELPPD